MATYTAVEAQAGIQPKTIRVGLTAVTTEYSLTTSGSVGTTILMIKVPQGATLVSGLVGQTNAGQLTVQVGDGIDADRYYVETTLTAAMGMVALFSNTTPTTAYTYSAEDTIDVVISRVSVSTLGGAVYLRCVFSMDVRTPAVT
jgi:hypothetical protein